MHGCSNRRWSATRAAAPNRRPVLPVIRPVRTLSNPRC
ncbi:hypothetical protein BSLA_01r4780 [Burkholderia stabilis]|nr:hypothetical protein BSLA_01r4780 [Burkholderia stabilis]